MVGPQTPSPPQSSLLISAVVAPPDPPPLPTTVTVGNSAVSTPAIPTVTVVVRHLPPPPLPSLSISTVVEGLTSPLPYHHCDLYKTNYKTSSDPHPLLLFARNAKKIFEMIATQEPFAPKARRELFFQKLNPETTTNSLCKIAFLY